MLKPRVAILAYDGIIHDAYRISLDARLDMSGQNFGNLLFYRACGSIADIHGLDFFYLNNKNTLNWSDFTILNNCQGVIIPASNFITSDYELLALLEFVERIHLPLVVLGLGAQLATPQEVDSKLPVTNRKLIKALAERSTLIGVRGQKTQDLLRHMGILNTAVIGCPSNFIRYNDQRHLESLSRRYEEIPKVQVRLLGCGDEPYSAKYFSRLEARLFSWSRLSGGSYVIQSCKPLLEIIAAKSIEEAPTKFVLDARDIYEPYLPLNCFFQLFRSVSRTYISVDQWMLEASAHTVSLGRRFHGNMIAFQAGCPAFWIDHDVRTSELISELALPTLSVNKALECDSIDELIISTKFDPEQYVARRKTLYNSMTRVINECIS